jgi:hypothetical protein
MCWEDFAHDGVQRNWKPLVLLTVPAARFVISVRAIIYIVFVVAYLRIAPMFGREVSDATFRLVTIFHPVAIFHPVDSEAMIE